MYLYLCYNIKYKMRPTGQKDKPGFVLDFLLCGNYLWIFYFILTEILDSCSFSSFIHFIENALASGGRKC